jgi:hypothetical protein
VDVFTQDAVDSAERRNAGETAPYVELWPENKLETLLARKPGIAAAHGLK